MSIDQMRKNYALAGLVETDLVDDPILQFQKWFEEAQRGELPDWVEVNAMTLSTAGHDGRVSSRVVLLKGIERGRLMFFTNYDSDKANQMADNPHVALCFFWPHLQRQVRIEGTVTKTTPQQSQQYFQSRPRASQLGALVSRQSSPIPDRQTLETRMQQLETQYSGSEVPCPENWGGYEVSPERFEFWQGRPSRLHDRLSYQRQGEHWKIVRLSP